MDWGGFGHPFSLHYNTNMEYKIYWVKSPQHKDFLTEGYIGITKMSIEERLKFHRKQNRFEEEHEVVLLEGNHTYESACEREYELRPSWYIGWNIAPGGQAGNRPPGIHTSGWTHSEESKKRRSEMWKGNKYGNKKTVFEGIVFESQKKAAEYASEKYGLHFEKCKRWIRNGVDFNNPPEDKRKYNGKDQSHRRGMKYYKY